ncbi:putative serine/threonine-protein kinase iks1 [Coemansia sp. IMI 203386]|nr:putative serine/threonine-protein kinase iks1 [Coemansia sp. IMI 203386]
MSPRRENSKRSLSQGSAFVPGDSAQTGNYLRRQDNNAISRSTQLIPYSPWRVILYRRNAGQVVMYNQDNDKVELRHIVPRSLGVPQVSGHLVRSSKALSTARNETHESLDVDIEDAHICPTCLQVVPHQLEGRVWRSFDNSGASSSSMSDTTADREYFELLARSIKQRRPTLTLPGAKGQVQPNVALGSLRSPLSQDNSEEDIDIVGSGDRGKAQEIRLKPTLSVSAAAAEEANRHDSTSASAIVEDAAGVFGRDEHADAGAGVSAKSFNQGYYERFFTEQNKLGKGLRGSVFSCQHVLDGVYLGHYAVKKVAVGNNHQWLRRMLREVKLLESLRHQNVVEYKHSWLEMHQLTKFGPKVPCLFILMEYANGGNLQEYMEPKALLLDAGDTSVSMKHKILEQRRRSRAGNDAESLQKMAAKAADKKSDSGPRMLSVEQIWSFFSDICNGLAHLHQLQIIHRDLKHMNLLLQWKDPANRETGDEIPRIMLTDFGECEILSHLEKRDRTGATGTMEFMAPELLKVDATGRFLDSYSTKSDMWSLGMVLYYLCYSRLPFSDIDDIDALRRDVLRLKHVEFAHSRRAGSAEDIPFELRRIMQALLNQDEDKRPDIGEVIQQVAEHQNLWQNRRQDESRFELHDSDMASNIGSDTPGMRTPQLRHAERHLKNNVSHLSSAATSLVLVRPDEQELHRRLGFLQPSEETDSQESIDQNSLLNLSGDFRRHSADESSHRNLHPQSAVREGSWTPTSDEHWADVGDWAAVSSSEASSDSELDSEASRSKRDLQIDGESHGAHKRMRLEADLSALSLSAPEVDTAFCVKTAILLSKVYALQKLLGQSAVCTDSQSSTVPVLMGITLILSALDIRQNNSSQLTLALLAANICVVFLVLGMDRATAE